MDRINFDLYSDLYIDRWKDEINYSQIQTSLLAVVAGDVSSDLDRVAHELKRLTNSYRQVVYIDGDLENSDYSGEEAADYLERKVRRIKNCLYLRGNVVVFNHVAFVGANLWWLPWGKDIDEDAGWEEAVVDISRHHKDLNYLKHTVHRMQMTNDVHQIVLVSHTVPNTELLEIYPDVDFEQVGSNASEVIDGEDLTSKVRTWCFGHYHRAIDSQAGDIRYVSNPRGTPETHHGFQYYPKRIEV